MSIIPLLLFCSLLLVAGSIVLFVFSARQGDCHEAERICLMPLEDDDGGAGGDPRVDPGADAGDGAAPAPSRSSSPPQEPST